MSAATRSTSDRRPSKIRSALTNDWLRLRGIGGNTPDGRRFRDLALDFAGTLGGADNLGQADRVLVRQAAVLSLRVEQLQDDIVAGKPVDAEQLVRINNSLQRALRDLRARTRPARRTPREIMAAKALGEAAGA